MAAPTAHTWKQEAKPEASKPDAVQPEGNETPNEGGKE